MSDEITKREEKKKENNKKTIIYRESRKQPLLHSKTPVLSLAVRLYSNI